MKKTPLKKNMQQNCDVRKDKLLLLERKKDNQNILWQ